jgi:hypothetical protein
MSSITRAELEEVLDQLEQAIHVPVVSGEMLDWLQSCVGAISKVQSVAQRQIEDNHPELFNQIKEEDAALIHQVENLKEEDLAILEDLENLVAMGQRLQEIGNEVGPHESQLNQAIETFIRDGEAIFMRIRKQEVAVSSWLQEALDRDRGDVD